MYEQRPDEIPFWLGEIRAFVNPPLPPEFGVDSNQFVYRADQAIRINREALFDHYDTVLRNVVRMSGLQQADAHAALQAAIRAALA